MSDISNDIMGGEGGTLNLNRVWTMGTKARRRPESLRDLKGSKRSLKN